MRRSPISSDAPKPDQFGTDIPYPAGYVIPRIQSSGVVRVAGVIDLPAEAPESERRLDAANRRIVEALISRWGMQVQYIPNSRDNAADLVANGQADLAVGVRLDWVLSDRVDFSSAYLIHGERLMVRANSDVETFNALLRLLTRCWAGLPGYSPASRGPLSAWLRLPKVQAAQFVHFRFCGIRMQPWRCWSITMWMCCSGTA